MMLLLLLVGPLMSLPGTDAATTHLYSDADMGIYTYSFPFDTGEEQHELRVHLRVLCPRQQHSKKQPGAVHVKGFAGVLPIASSSHHNVTVWDPHYKAPDVQQQQQVLFVSGAGGKAKRLMWVGPSHQGLWRLQGQYHPTDRDVLVLNGSSWQHLLPIARCSSDGSAATAAGSQQQWPGPGQIWNVVTTTSPNSIAPATLAHMMALHAAYHRLLGINGTVLRCNPGEARALAGMQDIQQAVAASQLIIWPWEEEHSVAHMPFYWQKPRNQLTLLAAFGRRVRLIFLDLDEYLVLPHGKPLQASSCQGRPLLSKRHAALSFIRYPARSCGVGNSSSSNPTTPDLVCWNSTGRPLPTSSQVQLAVERCPCQFHKPLVQPDKVATLSVHFVWTERQRGQRDNAAATAGGSRGAYARAGYVVPHACGFLLHLHAMVATRAHFEPDAEHIVAAQWLLAPSGAGQVLFPNGMAWLCSEAQCKALRPEGVAPESMALSWC